VGAAGEVVDVAPGYARNCLVPSRLAVPATAANRAAAATQAAAARPSAGAAAAAGAAADRARALSDLDEVVKRLTVSPLVRFDATTHAHAHMPIIRPQP
jgi:ribosomal protein L9